MSVHNKRVLFVSTEKLVKLLEFTRGHQIVPFQKFQKFVHKVQGIKEENVNMFTKLYIMMLVRLQLHFGEKYIS